MSKPTAIEQNQNNGKWDVGWDDEEDGFIPYSCGHATRKEAKAAGLRFDADMEEERKECELKEKEENKRWPNIARVRAKIAKMKDPWKAIDAIERLSALMNLDVHQHISWPLPSWKQIESGRVYGR